MGRLLLFFGLLAVLSAGCASTSDEPGDGAVSAASSAQRHLPTDPDSRAIYRVLVAEIAGRQGQHDVALDQYSLLSREVDDPRIAERAVQIGLFLGRYEEVLPAARRWAALAPGDMQARRYLTLLLLQSGETQEAGDRLIAWLEEDPEDPNRFTVVNSILQSLDDQDVVFEVYQRLWQAYPDSAMVSHGYALVALQLGKLDEARHGADRMLELKPDWTPALLLSSQVMVEQGEAQESVDLLARAVREHPDDSALRLGYLRLLVRTGQIDQAHAQFEDLAQREAGNPEALFSIGVLAAEAGYYDDADRYLRSALDSTPNEMPVYFELGRVAEKRGAYAEARDWYAKVSEEPLSQQASVRIGHVLAKLGEVQEAQAHFQGLRRNFEQVTVGLYVSEADALRESGHVKLALTVLDDALREHPDDPDLLYARALTAQRLGQLDVLERDLKRILDQDPVNSHALNALGYTLADSTDRYQEAYGYIRQALDLMPNDPAVLDSMGWVLYRLKRFEEALVYLRRAYAIAPDEEIGAHLGEVLWVVGEREQAKEIWGANLRRVQDAPVTRSTMDRFGI